MSSLRIAQVNAADHGGGAEKIALSLHQGYLAKGLRAWLTVDRSYSDELSVLEIPHRQYGSLWSQGWQRLAQPLRRRNRHKIINRLHKLLHLGLARPGFWVEHWLGHEDFDYPASYHLLDFLPEKVDLIHGHNLHGRYFDLRALPVLSRKLPVVLTLHDAWLLSGHCAHSFECDRWRTGCGSCPDLSIIPPIVRDGTRYNWLRKRDIFAKSRLYIATPSRWLMDKVHQSMVAPAIADWRVIPNGIDTSTFKPADNQVQVRRALGLPEDAKILLFAATSIRQNPWKDFQMLRSALGQIAVQLPKEKILFLALGEQAPDEQIGIARLQFVPFQNGDKAVAAYYQAADVYLHGAKADTFPNTVLEALACGTPVVATAVGGIPEQICAGETGFLVAPGDAAAMAQSTVALLTRPALSRQLSAQARQAAVAQFSLEQMVCQYTGWYQDILQLKAA
ncbi:MAG: glycosyltransferase [Cyanobacteria bacterium P01_H01_bin.119]